MRDRLAIITVALEDVEALRSIESNIKNYDDSDPRVYVCTWQTQRHQDILMALVRRMDRAFQLRPKKAFKLLSGTPANFRWKFPTSPDGTNWSIYGGTLAKQWKGVEYEAGREDEDRNWR